MYLFLYIAKSINFDSIPSKYLYFENEKEYEIRLNMPGHYNASNSLAALAVCRELGVPI